MSIVDRLGRTVGTSLPNAAESDPFAGIAIKTPVRVCTTANIVLNGILSIDGVTVAVGDRVLVRNQTDPIDNGIYAVSSGDWTRTVDFDQLGEVVKGTSVYINEGTLNGAREAFVTSSDPITPGVSAITFSAPDHIASEAEAIAGTANDVLMTPLRVAQVIGQTGALVVESRATASTIPFLPDINAIVTLGYAQPADGGGAACKRGAGSGSFTDGNGDTWSLDLTSGVVNPMAFGAKFNGSSDDTTALQAAITAAQSIGGAVILPPGTAKITSLLNITAPLTIRGVLMGRSVIKPSSSISAFSIVTDSPVLLTDFSISYATAANGGTSGVTIDGTNSVTLNTGSRFDRLQFVNARTAINVKRAQYWSISNCLFQNNAFAIQLDNSSATNPDVGDSSIAACTIAMPGATTGIAITSFAGLRIIDNKIIGDDSASVGINLTLKNAITSSGLTVSGNSIEHVTYGVLLQRAGASGSFTNVVISGNEFEPSPGGAAVDNPTDTTTWLANASISGNIVYGPATTTGTFGFIMKATNSLYIGGNMAVSNSSTTVLQLLATTGSSNALLGPNAKGNGLFIASDTGASPVTVVSPT